MSKITAEKRANNGQMIHRNNL